MQPLGITEKTMRTLMNIYEIDTGFFDLAVSFGDKPRSSDAGHGGMTVKRMEDGSYVIQYLFAYAEEYKTQTTISWTIRQIGVFHRFDPSGRNNLWIFLHAKRNSTIQQQIEESIMQHGHDAGNWCTMHLLVLSYLCNWRWCIRNLGDEIDKTVDIALTLDPSNTNDSRAGLIRLLKPQYLGDKLLPLPARLGVALTIITKLEDINTLVHSKDLSTEAQFQKVSDELSYHKTTLEGHLKSVRVLERKIQGISDLLAVSLTLKNQAVTIEINNQMLRLTNDSIDDNATVKVVTLVTLIYLPASFVSTVLGMNLFDFDSGDDNPNPIFTISRQFWIFVVIAVPLTLLTLGSWYYITRRSLKLRQERAREIYEMKEGMESA
ncbi:hypothetical protein MW887_003447 [Aspergillus wentii]|nr:hypothetical protein MW887_003447 [Aspergillus wentii]